MAGFRPAAAAIAVATAFGMHIAPVRAQPTGGQAIAGQASFATSGSNLLVTTQNAPGTSHSAINWQSFSVPAGSLTQFNQPNAASTSINRVIGADPSAIFGTLRSNGRLVLVNPAGITVGAGAAVDTAGFTASTLSMSDADAIAGRMRFAGNGGALQVDGSIVARSGDVVLIAPNVQTGVDAVVQANGATLLAAGQKVEITGRGLEGIRLEVQAPENKAVNLGKLQGDAVGIFAGTLRHSGVVQAMAVTAEGGKVLLKAQGDNLVSGTIAAAAADGKGGSIDVLGQRVGLLAGATLGASGAAGGGQVRVGGDYQGLNADVQNAKATYVDAQAAIKADATGTGDGGRVIVWSDDATRMHGQISARGGPHGGDGGFAEVSGKKYLEFTGRADLRAPQGRAGTLLLDPNDIQITHGGSTTTSNGSVFGGGPDTSTISDADLSAQLNMGNVQVTTSNSSSSTAPLGGQITLLGDAEVRWGSGSTLSLSADKGITLNGGIYGTSNGVANGSLHLLTQAGDISQTASGTIEVAALYASAGQYDTSGSPGVNGRVLMRQSTTNRVGTLAGEAYGPNSEFRFQNSIGLTIGSVETAYGSGSGVYMQDSSGGHGGPVELTTLNGDLSVSNAAIEGGTVRLKAANGSVHLDASSANAYAGLLDIAASANINVGVVDASYLYGTGGAGGGIRIAAGSGNVDMRAGSNVETYQSPIDVTAGGSIMGNGAFYSRGTVNGWIHLTASGGSVSYGNIISNGSFSGIAGGEVKLVAKTGVSGGDISSHGAYGSSDGLAAGNVYIEATGGSIAIGSVDANGGSSGSTSTGSGAAGGAITLLARGTGGQVSVAGEVNANGGSGAGNGGKGGAITVWADGDVQLHQVNAGGGEGRSTSASAPARGGEGGSLNVTSDHGNIALLVTTGPSYSSGGGAMVSGGWGYSLAAGGVGGAITLSAPGTGTGAGNIAVGGTLQANGGSSDTNLGADARQASNAITVMADKTISIAGLQFDGGNDNTSLGGAGGKAVLTSATGNIDLGNALSRGGRGGTLDVAANGAGNITIGGADVSGRSGFSLGPGGNGGTILLKAGGTVTATGSLNAVGGSGDTAPGNGGTIRISGQGKVLVSGVYASGGYASLGAGSGGMGGEIELVSTNGDVTATDTIDAYGRSGGKITVQANQGSISVQRVDASGAFGGNGAAGNGGNILLRALSGTGTVTATDEIDASGGEAFNGAAGNGGNVAVQAGGNVTLYRASARGGNASLGSGGGGAGGKVMLSSATGNISVHSNPSSSMIDVAGGFGAPGGAGGIVQVEAPQGAIDILQIQAQGGYGTGPTASDRRGGQGGQVQVTASGDIAIGSREDLTYFGVQVQGGDGADAAGGNGGSVTLVSSAGSVSVTEETDNYGISATGGGGAPGGKGGSVQVQAALDVDLSDVRVAGGNGHSSAGGDRGGDGGTASIKFGRDVVSELLLVRADGGEGGDGGSTTANGGVGGTGGSIEVGRTGGDWTVGAVGLDAAGGTGGSAASESGGSGGIGGNGGAVTISASNGSLSLDGASLLASAGYGGYNGDDTSAGRGTGLGAVMARAANDLSITYLDYLDLASFTGQAGRNIVVSAPIATHGGAITLSAGDPAAPAPNPNASLSIYANIDSTDNLSVPGGAISLSATGAVLVDVQQPALQFFTASAPPGSVQGGPIAITGAQVTIAAADVVSGTDNVAIRTDALALDGVLSASTGKLSIDTLTGTRTIRLGGTDEIGSLNITQSELDHMVARSLVVGNTGNSGSAIVESPVAFDRNTIDSLQLLTGGDLQLNGTITASAATSPATSDVVVLAANSIHVGSGGGINLADGRWLTYIAGALDNSNFGTLVSGQYALWNRTFAGSPPGTVAATGNRYLFAFQPTITIDATSQSKVYDGTAISGAAFTATPVVDASAYGNVFLQDAAPTISVKVANASKNVGSYAIVQDAVTVPDGYAVEFHEGVATITKRQLQLSVAAQDKVYDATTAAQASTNVGNRVAGDDLSVTVGSANFADKNVGADKAVSVSGLALAGADAGNYSLASTSASTSADITPAPVTVAADNLAKLQGTALAFNGTEFTATGLKGGETITSVSLSSDGAPAEAPVGAYAIHAGSAVGGNGFLAGNYQVSYLNGALAVISPSQQPEVNAPVATFATLFIDQVNQQNALDKKKTDFGKDDIVVTDNACKPS